MKSSIYTLATTTGLLLGSIAHAGDFDGIWFSGYAQGNGQITMQADFVDDLAKFDIEMRRWGQESLSGDCQYYARIGPDSTAKIILNAGASADFCAREGDILVTRTSLSGVQVSVVGLPSVPDFELNEAVRPIVDTEYATLPQNFDILDITLGMTRQEIEASLVGERGYVHLFDQDRTSTTANWQSDIIMYRKGEANEANDIVQIAYSARPNGVPESEAYAVMVHREANLGDESRLHIDTLRNALSEKYGNPTRNDDRRYGRDGNLVRSHNETTQFCEQGNRQRIEYRAPFNSPRMFNSHCGSDLNVQIREDRSTGLVTQYRLTISSVDYLNNDFWIKLGTDRAAEFAAFIEAVSNAETAGPEL